MITRLHSTSPGETMAMGETIGHTLTGREVIFLKGDLGTGKTLFTKGIARALGIEPDDVVSPSFTLINEFWGNHNHHLIHADLYRLGPASENFNQLPEINDYIGETVTVIEWAQYLPLAYFNITPSITVTFHLCGHDDSERLLDIETK